VLNLAEPTAPAWARRVLAAPDELLVDHAHCEKKAAGAAVRLLFRYPEHDFLHEPLARLAREELAHFEQVLRLLAARGIRLRRQRPSPYAGRLHACARSREPERLVDTLLCCALIEARSCERFGLLAEASAEAELSAFFEALLAAEARHHQVYVELAQRLAPAAAVRERLRELARHEARILAETEPLARMHA
jgi:tRNA-(ms[2]io[6]A)-hydroxylase